MDKSIKDAIRKLDILDKYNITHVGSYRNEVINIKGIKIAILVYTSIMNYYKMDDTYEKSKQKDWVLFMEEQENKIWLY